MEIQNMVSEDNFAINMAVDFVNNNFKKESFAKSIIADMRDALNIHDNNQVLDKSIIETFKSIMFVGYVQGLTTVVEEIKKEPLSQDSIEFLKMIHCENLLENNA